MASAEALVSSGKVGSEPVTLNNRIEILTGSPLPALDARGGPAFAARSLRDKRTDAFAIVCNSGLPPRADILTGLRGLDSPNLVRLVEWGAIDWPEDGRRHLALVYDRPLGRRLMQSLDDAVEPMGEERVTRQVIRPLVALLNDLSTRGIAHGDIRPTNLFLQDPVGGTVQLGECASTLPSYSQPAVMLSIERAMAEPVGRGAGGVSDDLYALGVTVLMLLAGRNPVRHLDDAALLDAKIEKGSYPALVGTMRISLSMMEVLRGLLADDPGQRWTLHDLDLWLSGRRLSPKQPQTPRRAARAFEIEGAEAWHARGLARLLAQAPGAAAPLIESGEVDRWLRRSLGDENGANAVQQAVESASSGGRGGNYRDRLVARVCMALDPLAPIRYKDRAVMVDALGPALAESTASGRSPQVLGEMIAAQLPLFWVKRQTESRPEFAPLAQTFELMRTYLERSGIGFGLERALYELNPSLPCFSPLAAERYVQSVGDLLAALDVVASRPDRPLEPLDRHIAAFMAAHYRKLDERFLAVAGGNGEPARRRIAILNILADAQRRFGPPNLPNLSAWMAELMAPAIDRFHNRETRERLHAESARAARSGDLVGLLKLVDDPDAIRQDDMGFAAACRDYARMVREIEKARREIDNDQWIAETIGRQVAATVASVVATLASALLAVLWLVG